MAATVIGRIPITVINHTFITIIGRIAIMIGEVAAGGVGVMEGVAIGEAGNGREAEVGIEAEIGAAVGGGEAVTVSAAKAAVFAQDRGGHSEAEAGAASLAVVVVGEDGVNA
jgi:hypothetical protein